MEKLVGPTLMVSPVMLACPEAARFVWAEMSTVPMVPVEKLVGPTWMLSPLRLACPDAVRFV